MNDTFLGTSGSSEYPPEEPTTAEIREQHNKWSAEMTGAESRLPISHHHRGILLDRLEELEVQLAEVMKWRKKWTGMCVDLESDSELQAILEKQDE